MKAVGMLPGTRGLEVLEQEEPIIRKQASDIDLILIKPKQIGISAIDRRFAAGELCEPPPGATHLVLGHQMIGRVVEVGPEVEEIKVGDLVIPTVRRGCGLCTQCVRGKSDFCLSGSCADRGICRFHGFMSDYVLERIGYVLVVPPDLEEVAILLTPLSYVEKLISETLHIGHRLDAPFPFPEHAYHYKDWGVGKKGFIVGGTALAVMTAFLLRLNSLTTYLMAEHSKESPLASLMQEIGVTYIERGSTSIDKIVKDVGHIDLVVEATGTPGLDFGLAELVGWSGVLAITTRPASDTKVTLEANGFFHDRVLRNQILFGAVSAGRRHFVQGLEDLRRLRDKYGSALKRVITHRYAFSDFDAAFANTDQGIIKAVLET